MREFKYIPSYVAGKTKKDLMQEMVKRCVVDAISYRFFDIQWDVQDKQWVAWFYPEKDGREVKEVM